MFSNTRIRAKCVSSRWPRVAEQKLKVLVISSIPPRRPTDKNPTWADLAELTWATQKKYCERWGYDYHTDISDIWERVRNPKFGAPLGENAPIRYFIKFYLFQHFLDPTSCGKEYDWVVWMDSDLVITNYEIPLEKFFNGLPGSDDESSNLGDIILTRDVNGLHATVIMMRRSALTLGFAWANANAGKTYYQEDGWADQLSMRLFLGTPPYRELVWYHSVRSLCAMPPNTYPIPEVARRIYEWDKDESLALHLSALSITKRIEIASEYIERLGLL